MTVDHKSDTSELKSIFVIFVYYNDQSRLDIERSNSQKFAIKMFKIMEMALYSFRSLVEDYNHGHILYLHKYNIHHRPLALILIAIKRQAISANQ